MQKTWYMYSELFRNGIIQKSPHFEEADPQELHVYTPTTLLQRARPNPLMDNLETTYRVEANGPDIGALIIRIGFWGPFYYTHNKETPK